MDGEVSLGGVYVPTLLLLALLSLCVFYRISSLLTLIGLYRLVAMRPLVDLALFILVLWGSWRLTAC
jgi:Protein of unknown function (DUF1656)